MHCALRLGADLRVELSFTRACTQFFHSVGHWRGGCCTGTRMARISNFLNYFHSRFFQSVYFDWSCNYFSRSYTCVCQKVLKSFLPAIHVSCFFDSEEKLYRYFNFFLHSTHTTLTFFGSSRTWSHIPWKHCIVLCTTGLYFTTLQSSPAPRSLCFVIPYSDPSLPHYLDSSRLCSVPRNMVFTNAITRERDGEGGYAWRKAAGEIAAAFALDSWAHALGSGSAGR